MLATASRQAAPSPTTQDGKTLASASPQATLSITTLDGTIYSDVRVLRTEADGLLVSYTPAGGGMGSAKLKFRNLSESVKQQYGYDPERAAEFERQQALGQMRALAQNARTIAEGERAHAERVRREAMIKESRAREEREMAFRLLEYQQREDANRAFESFPTWVQNFRQQNGGPMGGSLYSGNRGGPMGGSIGTGSRGGPMGGSIGTGDRGGPMGGSLDSDNRGGPMGGSLDSDNRGGPMGGTIVRRR